MVSATFQTSAFVAFSFRAVIASPCRPSSQVTLSSESVVLLSTTSETPLVPTSSSETSIIDEIYSSEAATSLLSYLVTESFSSTFSSVAETGAYSTGLSSTAESFATVVGTTTPVASEESTGLTATAVSETTTWSISETIVTAESEVTTWVTTETTDESTTALMSQTTTDETPASTTETTLPPVPTFELVARSQSLDDVVVHAWNSYIRVSTNPFPASWSSSMTYEEDTQHIIINNVPLCVWCSSHDRMAPLEPCKSAIPESQHPLTCERPSASGLKCHVPARVCNGESCTELGYNWDKFFLLGWDDGVFVVVLGEDDLTTERDAPFEGLEPVVMDVREASS